MRVFSLPLLFILTISCFASTERYPSLESTVDAGSTTTEGKVIVQYGVGSTDSVIQFLDRLKLKMEIRIFRFRDSLLSKSLKAVDSILLAQDMNGVKENLPFMRDQETHIKLFIVNRADTLRLIEEAILAGYGHIPIDSLDENDLCGQIADSLNAVYEAATGTIADSASSMLEAFGAYVDEAKQKELDKPADMTIGFSSSTHNHTNMRDDGIHQFAASPSIMFNLLWGFSAGCAIGYYPAASTVWDGSSLEVGYNLSIGTQLSVSAVYSHFVFSSASKLRKASFNNAMALGMVYTVEHVYLASGVDFFIGKVKDPAVHIEGGYSIGLTTEDAPCVISFVPALFVCWGSQDPGVTKAQLKKLAKVNIVATDIKSNKPKFGILGYEISSSLECTYKKLTLKFSPEYVIPANVADNSSSSPYLDVSFGLEYAMDLFY